LVTIHILSLTDGQTQEEIEVHQGEREMARDNKLLGNYSYSLSY
jgi:molecular chaperone DnaK (HSP70)